MSCKVSVIVPNYNHERFLEHRLETVFGQTYDHFEVILLDDRSTDRSPEILKKYSSHSKTSATIINTDNSGSPFRQWELGIKQASGEYIWIAESDDAADPLFLEACMEEVEKGADLIYTRSVKIDENGDQISDTFWAEDLDSTRWKQNYTTEGRDEICETLAYRSAIPNASSVVFKKRNNLFCSQVLNSRFSGDWYFWVNYLKDNGKVAYINRPLCFHRTHGDTTRSKKDEESLKRRLTERLAAIRLARDVCGKGRISLKEYRKYKYLIASISELKQVSSSAELLKTVPTELLIYSWLYDLNEKRHKLMGSV